MKKKSKNGSYQVAFWLISLILVILLMVMIFRFSAADSIKSSSISQGVSYYVVTTFQRIFPGVISDDSLYRVIDLIETPIRKMAHFSEYTWLGIMMQIHITAILGLDISFERKKMGMRVLGVVICILYAMSDEIHQYFVPGRACRVLDVCIDSAGIIFGCFLFYVVFNYLTRSGEKVKMNQDL